MSRFDDLEIGSPRSVFLIPVLASLLLFSVGEAATGCVSPVFTDTSEFEFDAEPSSSDPDSTTGADSRSPDTGTPDPRDSSAGDPGGRDTGGEDSGPRDSGVRDSAMDTRSPSDTETMDSGGAQLGACCLRQPTRDVFNICKTSFKGRCEQLGRDFRPGNRCGKEQQYPCCVDGGCEYLGSFECDDRGGTLYPRTCSCRNLPCTSSDAN